jgi:hypothetical protein
MDPRPLHCSRWPTQQTVRALLAPALVFIVACLDRQFQTDFWLHLARGCEVVASGDWIRFDHFTLIARGATVRDASWLSGVFYCRLFAAGGIDLVQTVNAAVLAGSIWLLMRICRREGASWRGAGAAGVVTFLVAWQTFLIRPQTFSILLFVLLYGLLTDGRRGGLLIAAPLILVVWANVHGSFVVGLMLIGVYCAAAACQGWAAGEAANLRDLLGCLLLSAAATLINPYGWRIYEYAIELTARVSSRHIEEWMPPPVTQWIGLALIGSVLLTAALFILARRRPTARELLLIVFFFLPAMHSARMVIWWGIVIAPMIASCITAMERDTAPAATPSGPAGVFCGLLLGLCLLSLPMMERFNPLFGSIRSPHRLETDIDAAAGQMAGEGGIFTRIEWGQYLDWRLGPVNRLFMDAHIELADDAGWRQYGDVTVAAPGWQEVLDRRGVRYLLLDAAYHARLLDAVERSGDWREAFHSGQVLLFVRCSANERQQKFIHSI